VINSNQTLRQYGSFTLNVLNDVTRGNEMLARAEEFERKRRTMSRKSMHKRLSAVQIQSSSTCLFDDDTGLFDDFVEPAMMYNVLTS